MKGVGVGGEATARAAQSPGKLGVPVDLVQPLNPSDTTQVPDK